MMIKLSKFILRFLDFPCTLFLFHAIWFGHFTTCRGKEMKIEVFKFSTQNYSHSFSSSGCQHNRCLRVDGVKGVTCDLIPFNSYMLLLPEACSFRCWHIFESIFFPFLTHDHYIYLTCQGRSFQSIHRKLKQSLK